MKEVGILLSTLDESLKFFFGQWTRLLRKHLKIEVGWVKIRDHIE